MPHSASTQIRRIRVEEVIGDSVRQHASWFALGLDSDGTPLIDPSQDRKNFAQGAATMVWCATAPEMAGIGGVYCEDSDIARIEHEQFVGVRPYAVDPQIAETLWSESVRLTGVDLQG